MLKRDLIISEILEHLETVEKLRDPKYKKVNAVLTHPLKEGFRT